MSAQDDRRRIEKALSKLDSYGALTGTMSDQEIAEMSMEGVIHPRVLGEFGERRADLQLKRLAMAKRTMEFSDVKLLMIGCWLEGFMTGSEFLREKLEGS